MRVGLYLQDTSKSDEALKKEFEKTMDKAANSRLDLLVFPEQAWCPGVEEYEKIDYGKQSVDDIGEVLEKTIGYVSGDVGCPVVFNRLLLSDEIMSTFVGEESYIHYFKHIATYLSPLCYTDYEEAYLLGGQYDAIDAGAYKLGMTVCYDSTDPLLNRVWGLSNVDLIANSTGGHVDYKKWTSYQKVRAIENNAFTVCTMAHYDPSKKNHSYAMGFDPWGRPLQFENAEGKVRPGREFPEKPGELYIAELDLSMRSATTKNGVIDPYINQDATINTQQDFFVDPEALPGVLSSCIELAKGLYYKKQYGVDIVFVVVDGHDIYRPELIQPLFYAPELKQFANKRYILVNRWDALEYNEYACYLLPTLRVRAAENYCACLLVSDLLCECIQVGRNKNSQVVDKEKKGFGIDLGRASGPEALWQTKQLGIHKDWRANYEKLVRFCYEKALR